MTRSFIAWLLTWNPRMGEAILLWFALRQAYLLHSIELDPSLRAVFSKTVYKALSGDFPLKAWVFFLAIAGMLHVVGLFTDYRFGNIGSWALRGWAAGASAVCWAWVSYGYFQNGFSLSAYSTFTGMVFVSLWVAANIWFEHLEDVEREGSAPPPSTSHTRKGDGKP